MATKKKATKKVAKKANKTTKKAAAKPAKKAPQKAVKKKAVKTAAKPASKAAKKATTPNKVASAPAKSAKSTGKPAAKHSTPKAAVKTSKRGRTKKVVAEAPVVKKPKNAGPESVANVSFKKSDTFASRAAAVAKQNIKPNTDTRTRYSDKELEEFRVLIEEKLAAARNELKYLQDQINRKDDNGTDDTENKFANMEDGSMSQEREYLTQMAARQVQYIENLEKALVRIKNKTYGICRVTGKLIDKERLRIVPHATLSMEAKMMQK